MTPIQKRNAKLAKVVRMLGADGAEAQAGLEAARRLLQRYGMDWHDVAAAIEGRLTLVHPMPERPTSPPGGWWTPLYKEEPWLARQSEPELRRQAEMFANISQSRNDEARVNAENAHRCLEAAEARAAAKRTKRRQPKDEMTAPRDSA
jgi:hypothetical protein